MVPFALRRAASLDEALSAGARHGSDGADAPGADFLAGGTDLMQLMKEGVRNPGTIVSIERLAGHAGIEIDAKGLKLGALTRMSDAARHPELRASFPVVAEALLASASPQVRNVATLGGNTLQRTRCGYFRDAASPCNKRDPGSGCPARDGSNAGHAILGASGLCVATYAGDFANALLAVDALVHLAGPSGRRVLAIAELHRRPGIEPHRETTLRNGEMIVAFELPASAHARRSRYIKVRERTSFAFALASAAVALDLDDNGEVREVRVAVGGVATTPWRLLRVEKALRGRRLDQALCRDAAALATKDAVPLSDNAYKAKLLREVVARGLAEAGGVA